MNNLNDHIEIFSENLNGWIVLNFHQFDELIHKERSHESEFKLSCFINSDIEFRFSSAEIESNRDLTLFKENAKVGDFVEVKEIKKLRIDLEHSKDSKDKIKINIKILNSDHDGYHNYYTVWSRSKLIMKSPPPEEHDYYVNLSYGSTHDHNRLEKVKLENIRFLSKSDSASGLHNYNDYKMKHIRSADILKSLSVSETEELNIPEIFESIYSKYTKNGNILYSIENNENVILITTTTDLLFIMNLIYIKAREQVKLREIEENLRNKKESLEKLNKILESSNKIILSFPKIYLNAIKSKILDNLNLKNYENGVSNLSYMISESTSENDNISTSPELEKFNVIIYGKENLEKIKTELSKYEENSIESDSKLCEWLKTDKNLDEVNKIAQRSKIVDYLIQKDKISHFGDEAANKNFKKLLQINLKYGEKFLKAAEENENIKQQINTLSSEINVRNVTTNVSKKK